MTKSEFRLRVVLFSNCRVFGGCFRKAFSQRSRPGFWGFVFTFADSPPFGNCPGMSRGFAPLVLGQETTRRLPVYVRLRFACVICSGDTVLNLYPKLKKVQTKIVAQLRLDLTAACNLGIAKSSSDLQLVSLQNNLQEYFLVQRTYYLLILLVRRFFFEVIIQL